MVHLLEANFAAVFQDFCAVKLGGMERGPPGEDEYALPSDIP